MAAMSLRFTLVFLLGMSILFSSSYAQTCNNHVFPSNQVFSTCRDLPVLNSYLHWTYNTNSNTLQIAYRHSNINPSRWVAWAINPTSTGMVGSQALVAYQQSNGTMRAYTSPITRYETQMQEGRLSFEVPEVRATYQNSEITIFATLRLSGNSSTVNQVWQEGPVEGSRLGVHPTSGANVQSMGSLNLLSGESGSTGGGNSRLRKRNIHGVLNAVSWGVLMPMGAIIARYVRVFESADPAWFYLHVACQSSAYIVGVAGWGTGLKLGSDSSAVKYSAHRNLGIALFCLGTLQVFALLLRPKKDHKYRLYWNIYHHSVGYAVIIMSIINIFKGFDILDPEKKWKHAYIGVIATLGGIALILEAITWIIVLKRKKADSSKTHNGVNGTNGHATGHGHSV